MGILWRGKHKFTHIEVAPGGAAYGFNGFRNPLGRAYFVNNITGSATGLGATWDTAMDELSTAITASEIYRQDRGSTNTNDYIRNIIVVQATGTAYSAISVLPNYCDIIGLGATTRGNGPGIVRIDGAGADAMASDGVRGLGLYNMQLMQSSAVSFYGLDLAVCYRSTFEDMAFVNNGSGGIRVVTGGSIVMNNVHCGHDTYEQAYGLEVTGGSNFNACKITNSDFYGETAGVLLSNTTMKETVIENCLAFGGALGWQETQAGGQAPSQSLKFIRCYGFGTDNTSINTAGFKITNDYTLKAFACIENANGTIYNYPNVSND